MTTITASMVKDLRERTGAGMMECKKALQEAGGDAEAAIVAMRKSGQLKAAKRAGRIAAEGVIEVAANADSTKAIILEINCETDFVAKDENFVAFANAAAACALNSGAADLDALKNADYADGKTVEQTREGLVTKIGENIQLRRMAEMSAPGIVGSYKHGARIGVLVALDIADAELAKDIAMHVAAVNPKATTEADVPAALIEAERAIFAAQAENSGKPADIIAKMTEGRVKKFLKEISLVDQPFVKDPSQTVGDLLKAKGANVLGFVRYEVGEGIEKKQEDFAAEVAAAVKGD